MLSADLAVIFPKYHIYPSSVNRSSNGLLILLLNVSAIQVSQVNRKPSSWDIKGAQGFPHIAENE